MVATTWFVLDKMVAVVFVVAAADMPSCVRLPTLVPAPSGRAAYEQRLVSSGLATTSSGEGWLDAGRQALRSTLEAPLPYVEVAAFDADRPAALAYLIQLQLGQRLEVQTDLLTPSPTEVFLDIFDVDNADTAAASAPQGWRSLVYEPRQGGRYLLRVQPEALRDGRLRLRARSVAALTFPVAGFDSASVHSRFGAPRDGGRRDIMASTFSRREERAPWLQPMGSSHTSGRAISVAMSSGSGIPCVINRSTTRTSTHKTSRRRSVSAAATWWAPSATRETPAAPDHTSTSASTGSARGR